MIEKEFDENGLILHVKSNPITRLEYMLNGAEFLLEDKSLPQFLRILEDGINTQIDFTINDLDIIIEKLNEVSQKYRMIKHAVILNSPTSTVYAVLIEQKKIANNYFLRIFSTKQAALKWLNIN